MVIALIRPAIIIAQQIWKYRKQIYSVVSAQDRYIKGAFVGTRVSKAAQYGWRSGAAAGGLLGSFISVNDNQLNDIAPIPTRKPTKTDSPDKARYRPTTRSRSGERARVQTYSRRRCPSPRKYQRM